MGAFDLPNDEVYIYFADGKKESVAFQDGLPYKDEIDEWIAEYGKNNTIEKITVLYHDGREQIIYADGEIIAYSV